MKAKEFYIEQTTQLEQLQKKLLQKKNNFAWLRMANMATVAAVLYFVSPFGWVYSIPLALILLFTFVQLIYKDLANKEAIAHTNQLLLVNEGELKALEHNYFQFGNGIEHTPKEHYYANDMDIFGHASLFQFLNRTVSEMGSGQLALWLLHPSTAHEIPPRQEAVKELSQKMIWAQQLQAYGKENPIRISTKDRLQFWLSEP
ncbi:MAG TPA: hypothetical protein VLR49_04620, partial [Ferruginibacter sp.]|nr:hypothetical protein [Ferruginibacter sp.]